MPTKCTITGTVVAPDGSPVANAQIEFGSAKVRPMTPLTIAPESATATTDEAGALTVELYPGEYSVRAMKTGRQRYPTFTITVPETASAVLADIIDLPPPVSLDAARQAVLAAQHLRDEAAGFASDAEAAEFEAGEASGQAIDAAGVALGAAGVATGKAGEAADSAAAALAAKNAVDLGALEAAKTQTEADRLAAAGSASAAGTAAGTATVAATTAGTARTAAETARDAAIAAGVVVGTYASTTAGLAAVSEGAPFWAFSGPDTLQQYTKTGGVAVAVPGNSMPTAAAYRAVADIIGKHQIIGRTEIRGGDAVGGATYILTDQPMPIGKIAEISVNAVASGNIEISAYSLPSGPNTGAPFVRLWGPVTVAMSAGVNVLSSDFVAKLPAITEADSYFAFKAASNVTKSTDAVAPMGIRGITAAASGTLTGPTTNTHVDIAVTLSPDLPDSSRVAERLSEIGEVVDSVVLADWGTRGDLTAATYTTNPDRQWVFSHVFSDAERIAAVSLMGLTSGEIEIAAFSQSGSTLTKGERQTVVFEAGASTVFLNGVLEIPAGGLIGFWAKPGALGHVPTSRSEDFGGYYSQGPGKRNDVSGGSASPPFAFGMRFHFMPRQISGTLKYFESEVDRLSERVEAVETIGPGLQETVGYVLAWGVGQSNLAGRATTPSAFTVPTGRSFYYRKSDTSLQTLADPTGTDGTALTGRASVGPAMAHATLTGSQGRIGIIFVNTAVGGTSILTAWASGGASWEASKTMFDNAISRINTLGLNLVGCIGVMIQGETDGDNSVPLATYKAAVLDLLGRMRAHAGMGDRLKLIISQIGTINTGDTSGYAAIRQAQAELAREGEVIMAHSGAKKFAARGLMMDTFHYAAEGYDEIGLALGQAVLAHGIGSRPSGLTE